MDIDLMWGSNLIDTVKYEKIDENLLQENPVKIDISKWPTVNNCTKCYIAYNHKKGKWSRKSYRNEYVNIKKIALIVESPHRDEFDKNFNPISPLNGASGERFDECICKRITDWLKNEFSIKNTIYEIKVFNPVRYQTSMFHYLNDWIPFCKLSDCLKLGEKPPAYGKLSNKENANLRNEVWIKLFNSAITNCKCDFYSQLLAYSPEYIVNACTGYSRKSLKKLKIIENINKMPEKDYKGLKTNVRYFILNVANEKGELNDTKYIEDIHPCKWL